MRVNKDKVKSEIGVNAREGKLTVRGELYQGEGKIRPRL